MGLILTVPLLVLAEFVPGTQAQKEQPMESGNCTTEAEPCRNGLLVPIWLPQGNLSTGDKVARALVYMVSLVYMFLGVSIVADRFMAAIEVITSKEKEVVIKKANGEVAKVSVRIWNETVSNLSLMALGSSAPEILLAIIEIGHNKFKAGDLGPSTIVGSAAFNLFVIISICVMAIPNGEVRRIKHLRVFILTATWSVFAYIWLYFIISVSSKGEVEVWEAVLTFAFFPATVASAYVTDRKLLIGRLLSRRYHADPRKSVFGIPSRGDVEMVDGKRSSTGGEEGGEGKDEESESVREYMDHRQEFVDILRDLRHKHPNADRRTLEEMAELEAVHRWPKSRAYYRIEATRRLTGAGKMIRKTKIERRGSLQDVEVEVQEDPNVARVSFDPGNYTVLENVGNFPVTVTREGGDLDQVVMVDFFTQDGTANAGSDYVAAEGTLVFQPGEKHRQFSIIIIDDEIFEEDEHFYVHLTNVRLETVDASGKATVFSDPGRAKLKEPYMATIMILDDDHPGIFHFEDHELSVTENIGELLIKVVRSSGARGCVAVPFHAVEGTAKLGVDFQVVSGELYFENDETEQFIKINIVDDEEYEKTESFFLELGEPYIIKTGVECDRESLASQQKEATEGEEGSAPLQPPVQPPALSPDDQKRLEELGKPRLGDIQKLAIYIKESYEFKSVVDKMLKKANLSLVIGTSSWREQFIEAITVSAGDEEDDDAEEVVEKLPSCMDYVMHFLTLFWKVLFATIPPTDYWGGWACFVTSILMIGVLTAVIGDLAASFGCNIGLKDAVTAISFVALGTSVPDTFASKVSAINDRYADSSIGNVTGSNAVNVFLGIGIAWSMAAIYHKIHGDKFYVNPGNLAMSVTVFCIMAFLTVIIMILRRRPSIGGELGGPRCQKVCTSITLVTFWVIYILISALVSYCYIEGF